MGAYLGRSRLIWGRLSLLGAVASGQAGARNLCERAFFVSLFLLLFVFIFVGCWGICQ